MKNSTNIIKNFLSNKSRKPFFLNWHFLRTEENNKGIENNSQSDKVLFSRGPTKINSNYEETKLYIKNMVCFRCVLVVKAILESLELNYSKVEIGEADIIGKISDEKYEMLKSDLLKCGLGLIEDKKLLIVEKIKNILIDMIHHSDEMPMLNYSDYLSEKLNYNYTYLAKIFSEVTGMCVQEFVILHKIERVKELMIYEGLTLSEIAWKTHYSSVAHLSNQFKKTLGITPTEFKNKQLKLHPLDAI